MTTLTVLEFPFPLSRPDRFKPSEYAQTTRRVIVAAGGYLSRWIEERPDLPPDSPLRPAVVLRTDSWLAAVAAQMESRKVDAPIEPEGDTPVERRDVANRPANSVKMTQRRLF
jgi:hypothetical protein